VLDLVARGVITSPFFDVTGDLVELNDLFTGYWHRIVPLAQTSSIAFPFSRMHNEPFWKLIPVTDKKITPAVINNVSSVTQLRQISSGAHLDEALYCLMTQPENRNALRETLLLSCFSGQARLDLADQAAINGEAYIYSQELSSKVHQPRTEEILGQYRATARDQGFRRLIVRTYDHRCALCGVRIVTPEGHTVVDAAHIVPWCTSQNDDVRNGMALCKLCHWNFDKGMLGISDSYNVIVSRNISASTNVPGLLVTLANRGAILPRDHDFWPAQEYLALHRHEWRL
jgi:putative restriction endonuclease